MHEGRRPLTAHSGERKAESGKRVFSGSGRIIALLLTVPSLFLLDKPADLAAALLLALLFWVLAGRSNPAPFRMMKTFIWLTPVLIITNALAGPGPKIWGPFSKLGLVIGLLIAYRLAWAAWMALVLIRTCPPAELLDSFRTILRLLHIPDRNISITLFLTLEMLPQFADIRITDFRNLPEAIARRIKNAVVPDLASFQPSATRGRLCLTDTAIILPAAGLVVLSALV